MSGARTTLGFIGLGQMGGPMARNLLGDDTELLIWSRRPDACAALRAQGARVAEGPAGMAAARLVFLCLPDTAAVEQVLFAPGGLAEALTAGAIVVDTSTIAHGATLAIHARLAQAGIGFLDAPVSGMQARAEAGTLTIMCGGAADTFDAVRPWLARMGEQILHMGPAGCGQLAKLVNQLLFDINCAALAEILPMAASLGLDPASTAAVVNGGTGRSYASEFFLPRILRGHFSDGYPLAAAYKDLVSAAELGAARTVPMPVLAAATATYQMALRAGHGKEDKGAMIRVFEALLDVRFRIADGGG